MRQHRGLLITWTIVIATFLGGVLTHTELLAFLAEVVAMLLAIGTFRRSEKQAVLRYPKLYRVCIAFLLVIAATCLVAASSTVFIVHRVSSWHIAGFAGVATTNLVLSILAWRALVRPTARRAALAGLIAVVVEIIALIFDAMMNMESRVVLPGSVMVTLYASVIATWAGALACMASLAAFEPADDLSVPEARVIDPA